MTFGDVVRTRRKALGMSQEKLAALSGYTDRSSITKIEQGKAYPKLDKLIRLLDALGMSLVIRPEVKE